MKIYSETSLSNFEAWSGGRKTLDRLEELDKVLEVESFIESEYPEGLSDTELNDFLWFEDSLIEDVIGEPLWD